MNRYTLSPADLNSGVIIFFASCGAIAKDTSVGGTSIFSNVPDIESLPPIAAIPSSHCALSAPSSAAAGLPQRDGVFCVRSKYSWNVRYALL